jgi:SAM-dependent methyltransferase
LDHLEDAGTTMIVALDFADRWTVRGSADELARMVRRAADVLDTLGPRAVNGLTLERAGNEVTLTVAFDHWQLLADLDYLDPRVAQGHFTVDQRDDVDFVVELAAQVEARTIVDFGCGTGQLAVELAGRGRQVVAIDPAKAMLDLAKTRDGAERVTWVAGDVGALVGLSADLIVMIGNIPSVFVTDDAWSAALAVMQGALRSGGRLAFGSWNPLAKPWERWGFEVGVRAAGEGALVRVAGYEVELPESNETIVAGSEWRYRTYEELDRDLASAGFAVEHAYGDWRAGPLTATCPDIVLVARRQ